MTPAQQKVAFEAVAVAQSAIAEQLDRSAVKALTELVRARLPDADDPIRIAVEGFVERYAAGPNQGNCMIWQGRNLRDAILHITDTRIAAWRDRADVR